MKLLGLVAVGMAQQCNVLENIPIPDVQGVITLGDVITSDLSGRASDRYFVKYAGSAMDAALSLSTCDGKGGRLANPDTTGRMQMFNAALPLIDLNSYYIALTRTDTS